MFKSKKCFTIALFFLILSIVFISGCSNKSDRRFGNMPDLSQEDSPERGNDNMPLERRQQYNRSMNPSGERIPSDGSRGQVDEDMQQQFEEMQKQAIDACKDKAEGDICIIESPRGNQNGTCTNEEGVLLCVGENFGERRGQPWQ